MSFKISIATVAHFIYTYWKQIKISFKRSQWGQERAHNILIGNVTTNWYYMFIKYANYIGSILHVFMYNYTQKF